MFVREWRLAGFFSSPAQQGWVTVEFQPPLGYHESRTFTFFLSTPPFFFCRYLFFFFYHVRKARRYASVHERIIFIWRAMQTAGFASEAMNVPVS